MLWLYLHTILPIWLLPTSMTLLLVLLGLLLRKKALCWAGLVVLWLASTALIGNTAMRAAEDWQVRGPIEALPSSQASVERGSAWVLWYDCEYEYGTCLKTMYNEIGKGYKESSRSQKRLRH